MRIKQQTIEKLTRTAIAKPLAWTIYACGVVLVRTARLFVVGVRWLIRIRKGVT